VKAKLSKPQGITFDSQGNLYIADWGNNRIRKVDKLGIITTVAGSGQVGKEHGGYSGDGGRAVEAKLRLPTSVAVNSEGNLFIADRGNHCIREVDKSGIITTVAGVGKEGYSGDGGKAVKARLAYPTDIVIDAEGNIYIADSRNAGIRKVNKTGIITTVVSGKSQFQR
jgi:sugar lactone lactonase YvrE